MYNSTNNYYPYIPEAAAKAAQEIVFGGGEGRAINLY